MAIYRKVLVPCTIERGGFGNERTYTVVTSGGEPHIGIAPWIYCYNSQKVKVEDEPRVGETIHGFVEGKKIANGGDSAKVAFPDGSICLIPTADLHHPPAESPDNVSVES